MFISHLISKPFPNSSWKTSDVTWLPKTTITSSVSYPVAAMCDPPITKYYNGLTINSGCTVTTSSRCKGLVLYINGDLVINGSINMSNRGASCVGSNIGIDYKKLTLDYNPSDLNEYEYYIGNTSGYTAAAVAISTQNTGIGFTARGIDGIAGTNGCCGSGGGGAATSTYRQTSRGGRGAPGTCYSGGSGGGGSCCAYTGIPSGNDGALYGGPGGKGKITTISGTRGASGGAGNNGAGGASCGSITIKVASSGTGGMILLVVKGNLTIGQTGSIISNGSAGGQITGQYANYTGTGGGGSGGGSITILHTGAFTNNGIVRANGGVGGTGGVIVGGTGGAGSIRINKIII